MKQRSLFIAIAVCLIVLAVIFRILPHPANFAPVAAVAIFGGAVLPRRLAVFVPLVAMVLSDLVIGFYHIMPIIWACYFLIALASSLWLAKPSFIKGAALTLAASAFFFIVTNFAVWLFDAMYPHTWAGLADCYYMALPFFRNTILSDATYTAVLFGAYAWARALTSQLSHSTARAAR
jgi:hypothetical protein